MTGALRVGWGVLLAGLLAGVLLLGFAATRGAVEPAHVMASIAVVGLRFASHARRRRRDLRRRAALAAAAGTSAARSLVAGSTWRSPFRAAPGRPTARGSGARLPMAGDAG
jgi:hypothetical protein